MSHNSIDRTSGGLPSNGTVVLHITESFGAGVASAISQYVDSTDELTHHLMRASRREHVSAGELARFRSVSELPRTLGAGAAIRDKIREIRPDVIHAHSSWAGAIVRLFAGKTEALTVYTPHCFAFERRDIPSIARGLFWLVERALARRTDTLLGCSIREQHLGRSLGIQNTLYVPNVAPRIPHDGAADPLREDVVVVGRISGQKDPKFLLRVVAELRRQCPSATVTWVGGGDVEAQRQLESQGVRVTGWVSRARAFEIMRSARVYLHCARWEGFPISILEANQLRLPIVARSIPALQGAPMSECAQKPVEIATLIAELLPAHAAARRAANRAGWERALRANERCRQGEVLRLAYAGRAATKIALRR